MAEEDTSLTDEQTVILGMSLAVFLALLLITLALWIWALVYLIQNFDKLQTWAKVIGILGLIPQTPLGPIITLVVVKFGRK
jgi:hypothetical protein